MHNPVIIDRQRANLLEHRAVKAWTKVSATHPEPTDVVVLKPEDKTSSVYRLAGMGPGGAAVIAKRKRVQCLSLELGIYRDILPHVPLRTLRSYGFVEDPDPQFGWLFLEDAGDERYSFDNSEHRALAAKWLGIVHTSLTTAERKSCLPDRGLDHWRNIVEVACETIRRSLGNSAFSTDDLWILRATLSYCQVLLEHWSQVDEVCQIMPLTLVHGDFCPKNVRVRSGPASPQLFPIDWDCGGWGISAADLSHADLTTYWSAVRNHWSGVSADDVRTFANIGRMLWALEPITGEADSLASDWVEKVMRKMRFYHTELSAAIETAGWTSHPHVVRKKSWTDLSVFGGKPAFSEKLHVGRPNIGNRSRLLERIDGVLSRRWLTNNGPLVQELEQRISEFLGVKHCVATCNGTVGLEIAIRALGLTGEVIVPSFTFVATAHALQWLNLTPVFCDVDRHTHNIDPRQAERCITPRTTGIIGVHLWGRPCEVETLAELAARHRLALLFDAAHAFGSSHQGRMIGNFGDLEVFSFHATKFFNAFEGGAVVTADDALAAKARAMRDFGFASHHEVIDVGTNGKMTEVCAAMGLTGLECLDEFVAVNHSNYERYQKELADLPGIRLLTFEGNEKFNYQYVVLEVNETVTQITRDQMLDVLHAENILARRYFHPGCHRVEPYRSCSLNGGLRLPVTEMLAERVLVLPTGTAIGVEEVNRICEIIRLLIAHAVQIKERF